MEDIIDMETELTSRLSNLQKKLDKNYLGENSKDLSKVQELIKANLQRSKVIQVKKIIWFQKLWTATLDLGTAVKVLQKRRHNKKNM